MLDSSRMGTLLPGCSLDYAFDEPMLPHMLKLVAQLPGGKEVKIFVDMDKVGSVHQWVLPASNAFDFNNETRTRGSMDEADRRRTELSRLASKHLNKKIFLEVYADGPTRTLNIRETYGRSFEKQIHHIVDLATEIRQLDVRLTEISRKFVSAFGTQSGSRQVDLYGRSIDAYGYSLNQSAAAAAGTDGMGSRHSSIVAASTKSAITVWGPSAGHRSTGSGRTAGDDSTSTSQVRQEGQSLEVARGGG